MRHVVTHTRAFRSALELCPQRLRAWHCATLATSHGMAVSASPFCVGHIRPVPYVYYRVGSCRSRHSHTCSTLPLAHGTATSHLTRSALCSSPFHEPHSLLSRPASRSRRHLSTLVCLDPLPFSSTRMHTAPRPRAPLAHPLPPLIPPIRFPPKGFFTARQSKISSPSLPASCTPP